MVSVAKERLNTEITETLRVLCAEATKATEDTEKFIQVAAEGQTACLDCGVVTTCDSCTFTAMQ